MNIRDRIKQARENKGWTQQDLSEHSGIARNTIAKAEQKSNPSTPRDIEALAKALSVSPSWLMFGEEYKGPEMFSEIEKELVLMYRKLAQSDKILVMRIIESLPKQKNTRSHMLCL